ncbi:MAG: hypothetical protein COB66_03920 [Coxiella sp. (in: Bacteria)]|nr:MAG: hypothetical protein COB66_03920 [Coxiella sp. (in: g-proteobacteria)]
MSRKDKRPTDTHSQLALAKGIAGNVAGATRAPEASGAKLSSRLDQSAELTKTKYTTILEGTSTYQQIANTLRDGKSAKRDNPNEHYSTSTRYHWFNLFLSLQFDITRFGKQLIHKTDMANNEFYHLAITHYGELTTDSRFNLALVSKLGFNELLSTGVHLSSEQWTTLMQQARYADVRWSDREGKPLAEFNVFFNVLAPNNQRTLKSAMHNLAQQEAHMLERFIAYFDINTIEEWHQLTDNATFTHPLLRTMETSYSDFAMLMSQLKTTTKRTLLAIHPYVTDELWAEPGLNLEDLKVDDFERIITQDVETHRANHPVFSHIIARFFTPIIVQASRLLDLLESSNSLQALFRLNDTFQTVVTHAATRVAYDANRAAEAPVAYHEQEDYVVPEDGATRSERSAVIKPPTFTSMITAAELFEQRAQYRIAVHQYCRAFSLPNQNKPPALMMHIAELATVHRTETAYIAVIRLLDNCIRDELSEWHTHRDPIGDLQQLLAMENHRKILCDLTRPRMQWQVTEPLNRALLNTTVTLKLQAGQDLGAGNQLEALIGVWTIVQQLYREGSDEWLKATLQIADIIPDDLVRNARLQQTLTRLSSGPERVSNSILLTRVFLELRTNPDPDIVGCFSYQQQVPSTLFCCIPTTRNVSAVRDGMLRPLKRLLRNSIADRAHILEQLNDRISPLAFTEADIDTLNIKLGLIAPAPAINDQTPLLWQQQHASAPPVDPPAYTKR